MSNTVFYIDHMGSEITIINSARVSFGNNDKVSLDDGDKKLIKYLALHKHMSPFEHCTLTVLIKCPLFIRSQIHRHRTFSYNEISRRYTSKDLEFFIPNIIRKQSKSNRQASNGTLGKVKSTLAKLIMRTIHASSLRAYNRLLKLGVPREQARGVLSQNLNTEFYMTGNLRNWAHFINLRDHEGAQGEVQVIARQVKKLIIEKFGYAGVVLLNG